MLIEIKIKIGHDSMFNIPQTKFKSAYLLKKIAFVQFQCSRTVCFELNLHCFYKLSSSLNSCKMHITFIKIFSHKIVFVEYEIVVKNWYCKNFKDSKLHKNLLFYPNCWVVHVTHKRSILNFYKRKKLYKRKVSSDTRSFIF